METDLNIKKTEKIAIQFIMTIIKKNYNSFAILTVVV